jgi:hypothetical protein
MNNVCAFIVISKWIILWMIFHTNVVEKIKIRIFYSIKLSQKSCIVWDNVEKYGRTRQATVFQNCNAKTQKKKKKRKIASSVLNLLSR